MHGGEKGPQLPGRQRCSYAIFWTCGSENNTAISDVSETGALQQLLPECSSAHWFGRGVTHQQQNNPLSLLERITARQRECTQKHILSAPSFP